jgi:heme exporter protein A
MLKASHLTLWRGNTCLFEDLTLQVGPGVALIVRGPNGAGKTSLLRVLCGLTRPEQGQVIWRGEPAEPALRGHVAYAGHQPALKADLTVRQNLAFYASVSRPRGDWMELLALLRLGHCVDLQIRHLSAGQKRRAALARVLMSRAALWLLDEPFTNVDRDGRAVIEDHVRGHLSDGGLAVIVTHGDVRLPDRVTATLQMGGG